MSDIVEGITDYLSSGGLFNPELADHAAVRDLLIDARETILALRKEVEAMKGEGAAMWRCGVSDTIILVDRVRRLFDRDRSLKRNRALANMDAELEIALQDWFSHSRSARPNNYNDADAVFKGFSAKSHLPAALAAEAE